MIRLVFTRASSFISAMIRWITGGRVTHVGIQLADDRFLHADRGGVLLSTRSEFLLGGQRKVLASFELKPHLAPLVDHAAFMSFLGRPYDYDGMIWMSVPVLSWRWFKVRLRNLGADKNEFWCSELVVAALQAAMPLPHRLPEFAALDAEVVSPVDLLDIVRSGKSFVPVAMPQK